ncbi:Plasmodium exported protein, unknown function [Plasmodium vivax]|uniref:Uncharacterized protein n=1 Tax=Plasmodium vivax TaxID=5855 RepID=A0A565A781_PLAVI|nr:Plasmodium exported protein, unknown function [Plasmodium vivax]
MAITKINNMTYRSSLHFLTIIVTFIILTWIHKYHNDENIIIKSLENRGKLDISLDIRTHRLLAKHDYKNEFPSKRLQNEVSYNRDNYKLEKGKGNNNAFEQLKQGRSNHVDDYLKCYKNRYSKKKGLSKLDCYYEKLLFNSFNKMDKYKQQKNISIGKIKRIICTKYGLPLFLLALFPLLSFILPEIKIGEVHSNNISTCKATMKSNSTNTLQSLTHDNCNWDDIKAPYLQYTFVILFVCNFIYYYIL